ITAPTMTLRGGRCEVLLGQTGGWAPPFAAAAIPALERNALRFIFGPQTYSKPEPGNALLVIQQLRERIVCALMIASEVTQRSVNGQQSRGDIDGSGVGHQPLDANGPARQAAQEWGEARDSCPEKIQHSYGRGAQGGGDHVKSSGRLIGGDKSGEQSE